MSLALEFKNLIAEGLKDGTLTSCSRWSNRRRIMTGDFAGNYSWKYHPWVKEMHDSPAAVNVAMKGAQLGVTEVAINRCFYTLDVLRRDVLYVLPNQKVASDFSKGRFNTALRLSPYLNSIFTDTNAIEIKQAGTNTLYIRGSRGEGNLVSIPVSCLILDEVDRMSHKEVELALIRLTGQLNRLVWALSTPTIPDKGVHKLYKNTSQDHFFFKCPRCNRFDELSWPDSMVLCGDNINDPRIKESHLVCKLCKGRLDHAAKPEWLSSAVWQPTNDHCSNDERGFYINQLYSFTVDPADIAEHYFRGFGDESARQELFNSRLGLPYVGEGAQITDAVIDKVIDNSRSVNDNRPADGSRVITMGVDQGKWNYVEVIEWEVDTLGPDINTSAKAKVLWAGRFHEEHWHLLDQYMHEWQVHFCVIDADPNVNDARAFARRFPGSVALCRYRSGKVGREVSILDEGRGAVMATVDRTAWLDIALGRFHTGRVSIPHDVPTDYRDHIKALIRRYEKDERDGNNIAVYVSNADDHFAHAHCYAEMALPFAAVRQTNSDISRFL